jgi:hypothetical protein
MLQDRLAILETQLGALDQAATPAEQAAGAPEDAAAESEQAREQATEGPAAAAPPTGRPITDEPPAAEPERQPLAQAPQAPAAETLPEDQGAENETDAAPDAASSAVAAAEPTGEAKPPLSAEATAPEPAADRPRIALQLIGLRSREGIDAFIACPRRSICAARPSAAGPGSR